MLVAGCATGTDSTDEPQAGAAPAWAAQLQDANAMLAASRYDEALERFRVLLREFPDTPEAEVGVGEAQLGLGDYEAALATFDQVLEEPEQRAPVYDRALQGRGLALLRAGRVDEAITALEQASTRDPTRWRAWNGLGQALDQRGRYAEAVASYQQALWAAPQSASVHNNLGFSLLSQGRHAEAVNALLQALELDPSLAVARANLRLALAAQGDYSRALSGVDRADLPAAMNNIGYIALLRGDHERAEAYFLRALEISPSFFEPAWRNLQYLETLRGGDRSPVPTS